MIIKKNRVLIVGAAGYISSVLVRHLLNKDFKVTVLDALLYDNYNSIKSLRKNKYFKFIKVNFDKLEKKLKFKTKHSIDCIIKEIISNLKNNHYKNNKKIIEKFGNFKTNQ